MDSKGIRSAIEDTQKLHIHENKFYTFIYVTVVLVKAKKNDWYVLRYFLLFFIEEREL